MGHGMKPGERIANRTKTAIKQALLELIHEMNYPKITVGQLTDKADVGRSTLYRHYPSKADVLVEIHKDIFETLFKNRITDEFCDNADPPKEWVDFFESYKTLGINPFSLNYKLGKDLDYLMNQIGRTLCVVIEDRLAGLYGPGDNGIPLSVLSQSMASSFSGLVMAWFLEFQKGDAYHYAVYVKRLIVAMVNEAVHDEI